MRILLFLAVLAVPLNVFAQQPADDDDEHPAEAPRNNFQFKFKDRPSFRYGEIFRLDVKSKWHLDFRSFSPSVTNLPDDSTFLLTRARFGLKGNVTKYVAYEVEREMRQTFADVRERHPWRDNDVDIRPSSLVRVKVGKFKIPFGMEENTS